MELERIAIDTSKRAFTLHRVDHQDRAVLRRELRRDKVEAFSPALPSLGDALEACGGPHHWGPCVDRHGPFRPSDTATICQTFVKRGMNDRNDAEAINEAASRPAMHFVPNKSASQQAGTLILKTHDLLVRQRSQLINAVRGHASEFGVIVTQGTGLVAALLERVASDDTIPVEVREIIAV